MKQNRDFDIKLSSRGIMPIDALFLMDCTWVDIYVGFEHLFCL